MCERKFKNLVINLRPATSNDLNLLRHWDEQPHVTASDPNDDFFVYQLNREDWHHKRMKK